MEKKLKVLQIATALYLGLIFFFSFKLYNFYHTNIETALSQTNETTSIIQKITNTEDKEELRRIALIFAESFQIELNSSHDIFKNLSFALMLFSVGPILLLVELRRLKKASNKRL